MLPLVIFFFVLILAGGMIVFWLGVSTSQASDAQSAADASALAAEKTLERQAFSLPPPVLTAGPCIAPVATQAEDYAGANHARVVSCEQVSASSSIIGLDVEVSVTNDQSLPSSSPDPGASADAKARASTDAFAQASPALQQPQSCSNPTTEGTPFSPHGGTIGFFAAPGTDFRQGCEPRLAGALDKLAGDLHLRLVGTSGATPSTGDASGAAAASSPVADATAIAQLHACGALTTVQGLSSVSDTRLADDDLTRPFATHPDEVELTDQGCETTDSGQSRPVKLGNLNVHLVPLTGGPQGTFVSIIGGGASSIGESALKVGCQIYQAWKQIPIGANADEALQVALLVASDESSFGQNVGPNRSDPSQSIGVFQQISDDGWGTTSEELDVSTATALFFLGGTSNGASAQGLLKNLAADPGLPLWELAQETQGSGAGSSTDGQGNYGTSQNMSAMQAMYDQVTSGACAKVS